MKKSAGIPEIKLQGDASNIELRIEMSKNERVELRGWKYWTITFTEYSSSYKWKIKRKEKGLVLFKRNVRFTINKQVRVNHTHRNSKTRFIYPYSWTTMKLLKCPALISVSSGHLPACLKKRECVSLTEHNSYHSTTAVRCSNLNLPLTKITALQDTQHSCLLAGWSAAVWNGGLFTCRARQNSRKTFCLWITQIHLLPAFLLNTAVVW